MKKMNNYEAPKAETIEMLNNVVVVMSAEGTIEDPVGEE